MPITLRHRAVSVTLLKVVILLAIVVLMPIFWRASDQAITTEHLLLTWMDSFSEPFAMRPFLTMVLHVAVLWYLIRWWSNPDVWRTLYLAIIIIVLLPPLAYMLTWYWGGWF